MAASVIMATPYLTNQGEGLTDYSLSLILRHYFVSLNGYDNAVTHGLNGLAMMAFGIGDSERQRIVRKLHQLRRIDV